MTDAANKAAVADDRRGTRRRLRSRRPSPTRSRRKAVSKDGTVAYASVTYKVSGMELEDAHPGRPQGGRATTRGTPG